MEQTFVQARVQCLEFSNGRIRVARSGQDSELRWFLAAVTVVSIVALYYLQLDWLQLIARLRDEGYPFGLLGLLDFHDFGNNCAGNYLQRSAGIVISCLWCP